MAMSLGGATAPAATPLATDANNPNIRRFNLTCLDADVTGTFNHGVSVPAGQVPFATVVPTVTLAAAAAAFYAVTVTQTQIVITKQGSAGSGGTTPGTTVVASVLVWNFHSLIQ